MRLKELFSEKVTKLWNTWEVRALILVSLIFQIIFIIYGSQRKYRRGIWIRMIVWSTYMSADWVATVALGNLAKVQLVEFKNNSSNIKYMLQAFWAPFLLLHLGGADTITANSLEDNELWSRHLLVLLVEVGVATYVIVRSWTKTALSYITIPLLIIGTIKYGERTYALRSASTTTFKEDLLSTDPLKENISRVVMDFDEEDGFVERKMRKEDSRGEFRTKQAQHYLVEARYLFKRFQYLFANLILDLNERADCYSFISSKSANDAFVLIEIELGFMYDQLYTKAPIIYSSLGIFLRCIIFLSTVSMLLLFLTVIDMHAYPDPIDVGITYLLLGGAVVSEFYAFVTLLCSEWTMLRLVKHRPGQRITRIFDAIDSTISRKRWSISVAQYNLIDFCTNDIFGARSCVHNLPYVGKMLEEYQNLTWKYVSNEMREAIYRQLLEKGERIKANFTAKSCKELLVERGDYVLRKSYGLDELNWSTADVEFDHSLLLWHIATDVIYYLDTSQRLISRNISKKSDIGKFLSDYMLYLLVVCPTILPKGIGEMRYRDTCASVKQIFKKKADAIREEEGIYRLLHDQAGRSLEKNQSVLYDGCRLTRELKSLEDRNVLTCEKKNGR